MSRVSRGTLHDSCLHDSGRRRRSRKNARRRGPRTLPARILLGRGIRSKSRRRLQTMTVHPEDRASTTPTATSLSAARLGSCAARWNQTGGNSGTGERFHPPEWRARSAPNAVRACVGVAETGSYEAPASLKILQASAALGSTRRHRSGVSRRRNARPLPGIFAVMTLGSRIALVLPRFSRWS